MGTRNKIQFVVSARTKWLQGWTSLIITEEQAKELGRATQCLDGYLELTGTPMSTILYYAREEV